MRFVSSLVSLLLLLAVAQLHHAESAESAYMNDENDMIPGAATFDTNVNNEEDVHGLFDEMHRGNLVGGIPTDKIRYPYFTALFDSSLFDSFGKEFNKDNFICGGSLIRHDVIITSARCIFAYTASNLVVIVNFTQFGDFSYTHARNVTSKFRHPSYYIPRFANDIELLFLDSPVLEVTPVPLNNDPTNPADNDIHIAIGAGTTSYFGDYSTELLEVALPILNDTECSNVMTSEGNLITTDNVFCAGYANSGKSACYGDRGGPIIDAGDSPETDVLIGLSLLSYECGDSGPSVFTRVSALYDWINCVLDGDCTMSPTSGPTTPPLPVNLPGPSVTVDVSLTTDAYTDVMDIYYVLNCSDINEYIFIVETSSGRDYLESNTRYNYSFTLPVGEFAIFTHDQHGYEYYVPFQGSITFSSGGEVLHEIMPGTEFVLNKFIIKVGDGGNCEISGAPYSGAPHSGAPFQSMAPVFAPADAPHSSPSSPPSKIDDGKCDDLQDVTFPILLDGALVQKTCDWLAGKGRDQYRATICTEGNDAYAICEETCGKCVDTCVDQEGDFPSLYFRGKMVSCEDLAKHGERWRGKYCDEGRSPMAEKLCKESCNTCD